MHRELDACRCAPHRTPSEAARAALIVRRKIQQIIRELRQKRKSDKNATQSFMATTKSSLSIQTFSSNSDDECDSRPEVGHRKSSWV